MKPKLKPKEELFCRLVAQAYTPYEAAARAGYRSRISADKLMCRKEIAQKIESLSSSAVKRDALAGYSRIAYSGIADAVRLCFADELPDDIDKLDLYCVSEIKRSKNGVEIKFHDRLKALERLSQMQELDADKAEPFYKALEQGARRLYGED